MPLRKRNDLLHIDAFSTRPTHGARILRFFNMSYTGLGWSDPFATIVKQLAPAEIAPSSDNALHHRAGKVLGRAVGLGAVFPSIRRSPYDDFMMRFHNLPKENARFQAECAKYSWQFPAGSGWMICTDTLPHAVLAGQYALEQTLLVKPEALVTPETSR